MELNRVNDIIIVISIKFSIPVLLWPKELSQEPHFYYHSHVQREVQFANTMNSFHLTEIMILWRFATEMFAGELSFSLLLTASKIWHTRFISALVHIFFLSHTSCLGIELIGLELVSNIILDSNLEKKVLIQDGSIIINQAQPNITQGTIRQKRSIVPRTSNWACLIWDLG